MGASPRGAPIHFTRCAEISPFMTTRGAPMRRITAAIIAAFGFATTSDAAADVQFGTPVGFGAPFDVGALLTAARGANPTICAYAAQSVRNYGWGDRADAPYTPLSRAVPRADDESRSDRLTPADEQLLLQSLGTDDACVRELSVRIVTRRKSEVVANALLTRLTAAEVPMREVAAYGLGLLRPKAAVEPLIRSLRDSENSVKANAAWALGRIEDGRALAPLVGLFADGDIVVRDAAVVAVGHMDSVRAVRALIRVRRQHESARVPRVAAWALGELESREAVEALGAALTGDRDTGVREMAAWALGEIEA